MTPVAILLTLVSLSLAAPQQSPLPDPLPLKLEVVSPLPTDYVTGTVTIEARLVPLAAERRIARMLFFADGSIVCTVTRRPFICTWNAGPAIRARQVRVVAELQDDTRRVHTFWTKGIEQSESSSVTAVQVPTTVKNGSGQFVRGLRPADFAIFEAGVQQKVSGFAAETTDVTLVLAVDTSSSMEKSIDAVKEQVKEFLAPVPAGWPTTLMSFDHAVYTFARPGSSPDERERAVDGLKAWGGTALYTAIVEAIRQVSDTIGRKAVVIFTDGDDRDSAIDAKEVRQAIERSDTAIYFVAAADAARPGATLSLLEQLAEISGGRVVHARSKDALREAFAEVREEIQNQYLLTYVPAKLERPGTWRPLSVKVRCEGCRVRSRTGYRVAEPGR